MKLFDNWYELKDEKTGRNYYYNSETKESTWYKPKQDQQDVSHYIKEIERLQNELHQEKIKVLQKDIERNENEAKLKLEIEKYKNQINQTGNNQMKKSEQDYIDEIEKLKKRIEVLEKTSFHVKTEEEYITEIENLQSQLAQQKSLEEKNPLVEKEKPKPAGFSFRRPTINVKKPPKRESSFRFSAPKVKKVEEEEEEVEEDKEKELGPPPVVSQYYDHLGHLRLYTKLENRKLKYLYDESKEDHEQKLISGNWVELYDDKTNRKFYYNTKTHKTTWNNITTLDVEKPKSKRFSLAPKQAVFEKMFQGKRLSHPPNYQEEKKEVDHMSISDFSKRRSFLASFFQKNKESEEELNKYGM